MDDEYDDYAEEDPSFRDFEFEQDVDVNQILNGASAKEVEVHEGDDAKTLANPRKGVKKLLEVFRDIHGQLEGGHKELEVRNIIVENYQHLLVNGCESLYGEIPGVLEGDKFKYRVELNLVGLHHQLRRGIDVIPQSRSRWEYKGKYLSVAVAVVVSGGYVDNRDDGDTIIYVGEGGNNHSNSKGVANNQTMNRGNMALCHNIKLGLSVRVVRKFDRKPPKKPYYRYDGMYRVKGMSRAFSTADSKKLSRRERDQSSAKPLIYKFKLVKNSAQDKQIS